MHRIFYFLCAMFIGLWAQAQNKKASYALTFHGYTDFYYSQFTGKNSDLQPLTTVGAVPGIFRNNISAVGLNFKNTYFRSQFTAHSGNIVNATWDSQLPVIQEANVGLHLFKDFYIDAGYFTTHIGMEGFMPKDNLLSSTSIITFNKPFYQRGIRAQYGGVKNFDIQLWLLDGYNIFRDNNESKSIGMLISYEKNKFTVSYSNIIGLEPTALGNDAFRTYHNAYINYEFFKNIFEINSSIDIGTQAGIEGASTKTMIAYINTLRVNITKRISATTRFESQNDSAGILTGQGFTESDLIGINMYGITFGLGYEIDDSFYLRYETRRLQERSNSLSIFDNTNSRTEHLVTIGLMFEAKIKNNQNKK